MGEKKSLNGKYKSLGRNGVHADAIRDCMMEIDNLCTWSDDVGKLNAELVKKIEKLEENTGLMKDQATPADGHSHPPDLGLGQRVEHLEKDGRDDYLERKALEERIKEIYEWMEKTVDIIDKNTNKRADDIFDNRKDIDKLKHEVNQKMLLETQPINITNISNGDIVTNKERIDSLEHAVRQKIPMDIDTIARELLGLSKKIGEKKPVVDEQPFDLLSIADEQLRQAMKLKPIPTPAMERRMKYGIPLGVSPGTAKKMIKAIQEEDGCPECHGYCGHYPGCTLTQVGDEVFIKLHRPKGISRRCPLCGEGYPWNQMDCKNHCREKHTDWTPERKPGDHPLGKHRFCSHCGERI